MSQDTHARANFAGQLFPLHVDLVWQRASFASYSRTNSWMVMNPVCLLPCRNLLAKLCNKALSLSPNPDTKRLAFQAVVADEIISEQVNNAINKIDALQKVNSQSSLKFKGLPDHSRNPGPKHRTLLLKTHVNAKKKNTCRSSVLHKVNSHKTFSRQWNFKDEM